MKYIGIAALGLFVGYWFGSFIQWLGISWGWALPTWVLGAMFYATAMDRLLNKPHRGDNWIMDIEFIINSDEIWSQEKEGYPEYFSIVNKDVDFLPKKGDYITFSEGRLISEFGKEIGEAIVRSDMWSVYMLQFDYDTNRVSIWLSHDEA